MKTNAVIWNDLMDVGFGTIEIPEPGEGEVRVQAQVSLVSTGTETRILRHGYPNTTFPVVPGYSAVGTVQELGSGVTGLQAGDRVFVSGGGRILRGANSLWGTHCQHYTVHADSLIKVQEGCPSEQAVFVQVAGIALHGVTLANIEPGERVVVLGLGLIGQCSVRCLLARGAEVVVCNLDADRRTISKAIGAAGIDPAAGELSDQVRAQWDEGPDAVFEVTGSPEMVTAAARILKARPWDDSGKQPRLVLQANYTQPVSFGARDLFEREALVVSPRANTRADRDCAATMIANGELKLDNLVPRRSRPLDAPAVYKNLMDNPARQVTAIFDWTRQ